MAGDAATRALALLHGEGIDTTMEETERLVQRQRELARERATLRAELHSAKRRSTRTLDKARGLTDQQPLEIVVSRNTKAKATAKAKAKAKVG